MAPSGEWSGRAGWWLRAIDQRPGRVLGGPAVRAASGGNLSRPAYYARWYRKGTAHEVEPDVRRNEGLMALIPLVLVRDACPEHPSCRAGGMGYRPGS
jgi:hypothetical protein